MRARACVCIGKQSVKSVVSVLKKKKKKKKKRKRKKENEERRRIKSRIIRRRSRLSREVF